MPSPTTAARALRGASAPGLWLVLGVVAAAACKDDDAEPTVEEIVEASARHESHLLELLEANVSRPDEARRLIAEYVATNADELDALASRRALLERKPAEFASAMRAHGPTLAANFERRRRLAERAPALMADPGVRAALGRLAAL